MNKHSTGRLVVGSACLMAFCSAVSANGFRNPPESAGALSRDGGKLLSVSDASAVAVNPANLADLDQAEAVFSLTLVRGETEFASPAGETATDDPWKMLPNLFAAWPIEKGRWVAGVGISTPFGQSTIWKKDSILRYSAPYHAEIRMVNVNPSVAARVNDRISVGAGLDLIHSELRIKQFLPWSLVVGNPAAPDGRSKFAGDGTALGWNAAARFNLTDRQSVALTYRSPFEVDYDGDAEISNIPAPGLAAPKSHFSSEVEFPAIVAAGYGLQVTEQLHVGVDVEWIEFSRFEQLPVDIGVNNPLLPATAIPQLWDDVWTYGLGAEYRLNETWALRAGYKFMETPIPDSTLAPTLPDADRHLVTAGVGYARNGRRVDLGYAYSIFDDRDISGNPDPVLNGGYDLSSHLLAISFGIEL